MRKANKNACESLRKPDEVQVDLKRLKEAQESSRGLEKAGESIREVKKPYEGLRRDEEACPTSVEKTSARSEKFKQLRKAQGSL